MGSTLRHISTIESNVFTLTPILIAFYKNMPNRRQNLLYAYLVFPIVLHKASEKLLTLKSTSRINRVTDEIDIMAGFQDRLEFYKSLTNHCLQYAIECGALVIDNSKMSLTIGKDVTMFCNPKLNNALKVASLLPKIFKQDVITTYIQLGIHQL